MNDERMRSLSVMPAVIAYNIRALETELDQLETNPDPERVSYVEALKAKIIELKASLETS